MIANRVPSKVFWTDGSIASTIGGTRSVNSARRDTTCCKEQVMPLNSLKSILKQVKNTGNRAGGYKHGYAGRSRSGVKASSEYGTWKAMKRRCTAIRSPDYKWYGARGISVCDRWKNSFPNFLADMGCRPSSKHSIDRIDNEGDYEPGNCKWSTAKEQARNRRHRTGKLSDAETVRVVGLRNKGKTLKWIGNLFNVSSTTVRRAIKNALSRRL